MRRDAILIAAVFMAFGNSNFAQKDKCTTVDQWNKLAAEDPSAYDRREQTERFTQKWISEHKNDKAGVVTIPVVVHVLYNTTTQNISTAQIESQIDILNEDFRLMNADSLTPSNPFWNDAADSKIEFCFAQRDPNGNPTTGITRTFTDTVIFNEDNGNMKSPTTGGVANWDPTKYLNIWVVDMNGGTLGFATFPSDLTSKPELDGVVIRHQSFGNIGTAGTEGWVGNDLGRTASHEVGHWLNLNHIWGDQQCGDDLVTDTPEHEADNSGCPSFPHNAFNICGTGADGEMFMNYMDYCDDACLVMFTFGQKDRMQAALSGPRSAILTSNGCSPATGINTNEEILSINMYPNPSNGLIYFNLNRVGIEQIELTDITGRTIMNELVISDNFSIDLSNVNKGAYFVKFYRDNQVLGTKKLLIN